MKKVELLSPAGSFAAVIAAVSNGADAVYLGSKLFNARRLAHNFSGDELQKAVQYCHMHKVKVYMTLNILVKNHETPAFLAQAAKAVALGVDAFIMQDLTFAPLLKKTFPDIEIHASTQSTLMNSASIDFWKKYVDVFVLARELTKQEVKEIYTSTKATLEVFVHGHLCISYSGQCLISSLIGKRSGNRGMCASSCRKQYNGDEYLLSAKDLCLINNVKDVIESGAKTLKIEGRMKSSEYVATTTRYYREQIDSYYAQKKTPVTQKTIKDLKLAFNRNFTSGYFSGEKAIVDPELSSKRGIVLGQVRKGFVKLEDSVELYDGITTVLKGEREGGFVHKITNEDGEEILKAKKGENVRLFVPGFKNGARVFLSSKHDGENLLGKTRYVPIEIGITIAQDTKPKINIKVKEDNKTFFLETKATKPKKHPLTEKGVVEQFEKFESSIFKIRKIEVKTDNSFVPKSEITAFRKQLDSVLLDFLVPTKKVKKIDTPTFTKKRAEEKMLHVQVYSLYGVEEAIKGGAGIIYYNLFAKDFAKAQQACEGKVKLYAATPMVLTDKDTRIVSDLVTKYKPEGILANNIAVLNLGFTQPIILGYQLNIFNDNQMAFYSKKAVASIELNLKELSAFTNKKEVIFYTHGRPIVMSFKEQFKERSLTDGKNFTFPLRKENETTQMLYSKTIATLQHVPRVLKAGITQLFLDLEENVYEVTNTYKLLLEGKSVSIRNLKRGVTVGNIDKGVM